MSGYDLDPTAPAAVALQAGYQRLSDQAAGLPGARLDLAYGPHPRHRLDIFAAGQGAPALVFFHGGYWRAGSKDARRFPAPEWCDRGVTWIAVNYRLLPESDLAEATADARAAVAWIAANAADLGLAPDALHLCGNSAGGHLAAMTAAQGWPGRPPVASLTAISGLFDLAPLVQVRADDWAHLTGDAIRDLSPIHQLPPPGLPMLIGWGGAETTEFEFQSRRYAEACRTAGNKVDVFTSPGADHFRIIGEFGQPGSPLFDRLERLVGSTAR